jgi:hypothetical protein
MRAISNVFFLTFMCRKREYFKIITILKRRAFMLIGKKERIKLNSNTIKFEKLKQIE